MEPTFTFREIVFTLFMGGLIGSAATLLVGQAVGDVFNRRRPQAQEPHWTPDMSALNGAQSPLLGLYSRGRDDSTDSLAPPVLKYRGPQRGLG